jgi:hypothetical protein
MTRARKAFLSLNDTPYYHVVARCVRRAWLCGIDEYAGKDHQQSVSRAHLGQTPMTGAHVDDAAAHNKRPQIL